MQIDLEVINDGISGDHHTSGEGTYNILVTSTKQDCATCLPYQVEECKPEGHYSYTIDQSVTTVGATVAVTNIQIDWGRDWRGRPLLRRENLSNLKDKNDKPLQIVLYAKGNGANKGKLVFDYERVLVKTQTHIHIYLRI